MKPSTIKTNQPLTRLSTSQGNRQPRRREWQMRSAMLAAAGLVISGTVILAPACSQAQEVQLSALDGRDGFRLSGAAIGDELGCSVSDAGDINGDGFADIIVGASYADPNGAGSSGASYVVFGKASGFTPSLNVSNLTGAEGFALGGVPIGERSGKSVSGAGDINGDGFADLIVGAPYAQTNGLATSGASYVVFGKASGFSPTVNLSTLSGPDGFVLNGETASDNSGWSVSGAGDINGDGLADLLIGARLAAPNGNMSGASYVVFGKVSGFSPSVNLSSLSGADGFRLAGVSTNDHTGSSVSGAGDVNGDGLDDLVVGASYANPNGIANSGASYVVFGKASGFAPSINLSSLAVADGFRVAGAAANDRTGQSVSGAGDVNGDGFADIIVGAFTSSPNGLNYSGASYVVFGKGSGFATSVNLSALTGTDGFRVAGAAVDDFSGTSVSGAGDVNADGFADLIIGANFADPNGQYSGSSYVVFGKASGFASSLSLSTLTDVDGFRIDGVAATDRSGTSVSGAGDVNRDGFGDVVIGATRADPNGNDSGASYVVFGGNGSSAIYRGRTGAGDSLKTPVGITVSGSAPSSRVWLDFDGGTASSLERVTLTREARDDLRNLEPTADGSRTVWDVHSNREGWTTCAVTLQYTDAEIAGISGGESGLAVFRAPTPAGPWERLTDSSVDTARNQVTASTTRLAFFTVAATSVPATMTQWEVE